jgi:hypothetical protein
MFASTSSLLATLEFFFFSAINVGISALGLAYITTFPCYLMVLEIPSPQRWNFCFKYQFLDRYSLPFSFDVCLSSDHTRPL